MKTIKNRLKKLNSIANQDIKGVVLLTCVDGKYIVKRQTYSHGFKETENTYDSEEKARKSISDIKEAFIFWDDILFSSGE